MSVPAHSLCVRGVVPPLVTPLAGPDTLDVDALERLINHVVAGGVHGVFLLGSTGEGPSLSHRLRREVVAEGCRLINGRVPVLVGVSDTAPVESVALARLAADCGADAVVATSPYYFKPGAADLVRYFAALARQSPVPLYLYNMPGMTGTVIEPGTVRELLDVPEIAGIKDSSGDWNYFEELLELAGRRSDWSVFMGREELGAEAMRKGAAGVVAGGANLVPRLHADACAALATEDRERQDALNDRLVQVADAVFSLGGPGTGFIQGLKAALSLAGVCRDELAPPFPPLPPAERAVLHQRLLSLGVLAA